MPADEAEAAMGRQAGTGPQLPSAPCALRGDPPHGHGQLLWAGAVRRHIAEHAELSPDPAGLLRHRLQVSPRATYHLSAISLTLPLPLSLSLASSLAMMAWCTRAQGGALQALTLTATIGTAQASPS